MGQRLENAKNLYLEGIRDGHIEEAINRYTGRRYTQHSAGVRDGREGFIEFFQDFVKRNPVRDIEIVRGFEDGRYVFVQAHQRLNNGEFEYVTADIFDTDDDGKIIEHWDVIAELAESDGSGHNQIDGAADPTDFDKTEENKAFIRSYLEDPAAHSATYLEVHKVVGSGDLVVALSHVDDDGTELAVMDIFRVTGGRIAQHWDVTEAIAPEAEWANSGKF